MFLGSAVAEQGQEEKGLELMRQGLAAQRAIGGRILEQYWLALQIAAYLNEGQCEQGRAALAEACAVAENGECIWEAEVYRLHGELRLQELLLTSRQVAIPSRQPVPPDTHAEVEPEAYFQKALAIARRQHAKSLELRAATSLARLWQQQGKRREAHRLLSEVYTWFTEGFDTKDLQEAKALLGELG
jgi:predicted ATPase